MRLTKLVKFAAIHHIDAHRYFYIDHIGLFATQVLCGLCENPIVDYVVNSY